MAEGTLQSIFMEQEERERLLNWKHPWFNLYYNYLLAALVVILFIGFGQWGFNIYTDNTFNAGKDKAYTEIAEEQALKEAEEEAQKRQAQQDEAELIAQETDAIARMLFGIRMHTEKYHYTEDDLRTYARCPVNRAIESGKTIMEVLAEEGQFTAYSEHNNIVPELHDLAEQFIKDLHNGNLKPCDTKFRYAVLSDMGIWLVDDPNKNVPERWHE